MRIYEVETLWDGREAGEENGRKIPGNSAKNCFISCTRLRNMLLSLSLQTVPLMLNSYVSPLAIETAA